MGLTKNDVLSKLDLENFETLGSNDFEKFADLASQMNTDALKDAVSQIGDFEGIALEAFRACSASNSKCIDMCDKIVTVLTRIVSSGEKLDSAERIEYLRQMRKFTKMAHQKDTEQKGFAFASLCVIGGLLLALFFGGGSRRN